MFRRLIDANDEEEANARLSNDELASNVFVSPSLDDALSVTETSFPLSRLSSLRDMVCCESSSALLTAGAYKAYSETSAHSLTFAFALLAIHPDIQQHVYEETKALWPSMKDEPVRRTLPLVLHHGLTQATTSGFHLL